MKYRMRYLHEGKACYTGTHPYSEAKKIVDAGLRDAVVLDEPGFPQVYPKGGGNATAKSAKL